LKAEALRWLTERGAQDQHGVYSGARNRPVLLDWLTNEAITMGRATDELGCSMTFIHHSRLRLNETNIEDELQRLIQPFPLGVRLHRFPAKGAKLAAKATEERKDSNFLCKTFMTSFRITAIDPSPKSNWVALNNKRCKINY
jgi:hypothetical protein